MTERITYRWIKYSAIASVVIIVLLITEYIWEFPHRLFTASETKAHRESFGTFGDFIGGVIGTFFAFLASFLMYIALKSQRELTKQSDQNQYQIAERTNRFQRVISDQNIELQRELAVKGEETELKLANMAAEEARLQRFNSLFFELLNLWYRQRDILNRKVPSPSRFNSYFDWKKEELYNQYSSSSYYYNCVEKAANLYRSFYLQNSSDLAPVFRTLYRLMDLIHESEIDEDEKRQYAKIVRANLSESELFFLRYNAMIEYGEKFIENINRYRLLKHLPMMSLLEMKKYREKIENRKQHSSLPLNLLIQKASKIVYSRYAHKTEFTNAEVIVIAAYGKYALSVETVSPRKLVLRLSSNPNINNNHPLFVPFTPLSIGDLRKLMTFILQEIFHYSNFERFHPQKEIAFRCDITSTHPFLVLDAIVECANPLRLSHPDWDEKYNA